MVGRIRIRDGPHAARGLRTAALESHNTMVIEIYMYVYLITIVILTMCDYC